MEKEKDEGNIMQKELEQQVEEENSTTLLLRKKSRNEIANQSLVPATASDEEKNIGTENESEDIKEQPKPETLVFYHKDEGVDSSFSDSGSKQMQSSSTFLSSEISREVFAIHGSPEEIESSAQIETIKGDDLEATEIDVEKVLQKQNTHDLYCPNCNSCITRRVILRKRKRRVRISDEEVKENKLDPNLVTGSVQVSNDGGGVDDSTELPILDENEHDREPDVFRCLSCFSFFIPNGNGFKSFRVFGDKTARQNVQEREVTTSTRKNWFTSLFAANKQKTFVDQSEAERDVRAPLLSKLSDQTGEPSSPLDVKFQGQTSGIAQNIEALESGDEILPFPKQDLAETGETVFGLEDKSNEATLKMNQTDATMEHIERHPVDQLEEFKNTKSVKLSHVNNMSIGAPRKTTKVTNGKSANNAFSPPQGGLKLLISPAGGMVIPEIPDEGHNKPTKSSDTRVEAAPYNQLQVGACIPTDSSAVSTEAVDSWPAEPSQTLQDITTPTVTGNGGSSEVRKEFEIEVVKSIVYGGLAESITSLSIVSSAAGGGASTLNVLALGMANLIGGLFIICQNLWEIRNDRAEQVSNQISDQVSKHRDRYQELLGRRENFILHATLALLSYFIFGLLPPVVYGFSFHKSNNKELKLLVVSAASLLCITMLATARAYVQTSPKPYRKTILTFVILGIMVSGVSYASGLLFERLLDKLRVFRPSSDPSLHLFA